MGRVINGVRRHAIVAAAGSALLLTGVGFGAAAVTGTDEASDSTEVTTTIPEQTTVPEAPAPKAEDTAGPTVADVTTAPEDTPVPAPAPAPAPDEAPPPVEEPATDPGIGTTGQDGRYTPAPPRQNPGEPPPGPDWGTSGADGEPAPGDPDYEGPIEVGVPDMPPIGG